MKELMIGIKEEDMPPSVGEVIFDTPGIHYWTIPKGIELIHAVGVGSGSNDVAWSTGRYSGGGGLSYRNNITVIPGSKLVINVGAPASTLTTSVDTFITNEDGTLTLLLAQGWNPNTPTVSAKGGKAAASFNTGGR